MRALVFLIFFISIQSFACIEIIKNSRANEEVYNSYADNKVNNCIRFPYIQKDFSPQGVHITDQNTAYISMHHKKTKLSSRIIQADVKTGKVLKVYELMGSEYRGYLGKIQTVSLFDNESKFVIPLKKAFCIFDKKNAKLAINGFYKAHILKCQKQELEGGIISSISYSSNQNNQKYIWTIVSKEKKNKLKIFGYKIVKNKILKQATYKFDLPKALSKIESLVMLDSSLKKHRFLLANSSSTHTLKMYEIKFTYNKLNKLYNYKLTAYKNNKDSRRPASITKIKKSKNLHKKVSLKESIPWYLYKNLPVLNKGLKTMIKVNSPMILPK